MQENAGLTYKDGATIDVNPPSVSATLHSQLCVTMVWYHWYLIYNLTEALEQLSA
jgi:hypothetical protein